MTTYIGSFGNRTNRYIRQIRDLKKAFGVAFVVKDQWGNVVQKFNNLTSARNYAKRISLSDRGITFSVWSGKGFTVSVGIRYRAGGRR